MSRRAIFRNIPYIPCVYFLIALQNAEVSVTLLKSDSTRDTLPAILKIFGANDNNNHQQ